MQLSYRKLKTRLSGLFFRKDQDLYWCAVLLPGDGLVDGVDADDHHVRHEPGGDDAMASVNPAAHGHLFAGTSANENTHTHGSPGENTDAADFPSHHHAIADTTGTGAAHTHTVGIACNGVAHNHGLTALATAAGAAHNHTASGATAAGSAHDHAVTDNLTATDSGHTHGLSGLTDWNNGHSHPVNRNVAVVGHTHTTSGNSAAGAAHRHLLDHTHTWDGNTDSAGATPHTHSISVSFGPATSPQYSGYENSHVHASTLGLATVNHQHNTTGDTDAAGVGQGHRHAVGTLASTATGATHTHGFTAQSVDNESAHTHSEATLAVGNESTHTHPLGGNVDNEAAHIHTINTIAAANESTHDHGVNDNVNATGPTGHTHSFTAASAAGAAHSHGAGTYTVEDN